MWWNSFSILFSHFTNFEEMLYFNWIEFCKPCVIHGLVRDFSSFLLRFLISAWASNKLSIFYRYSFIEKLPSLFSLYKICPQFIWLKSDINLLLSSFFQSRLRILDFVTGNCGRWSENVDVTLPDSVSSKY